MKVNWNSGKKTKPRKNKKVLGFVGGSFCEVWFDGERWLSGNAIYHESAVSHWIDINKPRIKKPKKVEFKTRKAPSLMGMNFEPFKSQVDGSIITDHSSLREHNKRNGVTNIADYSPDHFKKRGKEMALEASGQTEKAKNERKQLIAETLHKHGV